MNVIILGSKGMLGQMAESYFSQNYNVITINDRYTTSDRHTLINKIKECGEGFIINCIGRIVQKSTDPNELYFINTVLPLDIYENKLDGQVLIQPSTDCVFNGKTKEKYKKTDKANADDDYGVSKRLGEIGLENKENAYIIRVSIIGTDEISYAPKGLLGWFLSQPDGSKIKGYSDHFWNGITTLEWCKKVDELLISKVINTKLPGNVLQLGMDEVVSKYEMLENFKLIFEKKIILEKYNTGSNVFKCLKPDIISKCIIKQLIEMKLFTS